MCNVFFFFLSKSELIIQAFNKYTKFSFYSYYSKFILFFNENLKVFSRLFFVGGGVFSLF